MLSKKNVNFFPSLTNNKDPIEISEIRLENSFQEEEPDSEIKKEVTNCMLFLQFVATEFSSTAESVLTADQKKHKMLAIYLKDNEHHASFIDPIINDVIVNKDGLRDFLVNKSSAELINLSATNSQQVNSLLEADDRTQSAQEIIKEKLTQFTSFENFIPVLDAEIIDAQPANSTSTNSNPPIRLESWFASKQC